MFKYMYNILQLGFSIGWYLYQDCLPSITESWRRTCRWRLHEHEVDEDRIDAFQVWCREKILSGLLKPWFVLFGTKCALYSSHDECFFWWWQLPIQAGIGSNPGLKLSFRESSFYPFWVVWFSSSSWLYLSSVEFLDTVEICHSTLPGVQMDRCQSYIPKQPKTWNN